MTDLMAKDLDLALAYGGPGRGPLRHHGRRPPGPTAASTAGYGREDFSALAKIVLGNAGVE